MTKPEILDFDADAGIEIKYAKDKALRTVTVIECRTAIPFDKNLSITITDETDWRGNELINDIIKILPKYYTYIHVASTRKISKKIEVRNNV